LNDEKSMDNTVIVSFWIIESLSTLRQVPKLSYYYYYTATRQKAEPKEHMSTEATDTGHSSKTPEAQHVEGEQRNAIWKQ
jgi:hypothetical protein